MSDKRVILPRPRISGYPRAPGRLMGPGPAAGKAGPTPAESAFYFGPISALTYSDFAEVSRNSVRGSPHGKIVVACDLALSAATFLLVAPQLYVDVQVVGYTNGVPEIMAYGAVGMTLQAGTPLTPSNGNMDSPPIHCEWDDSFGFDEVGVNIRTMGNGGVPLNNNYGAPLWTPSTAGNSIQVLITTGGALGVAQAEYSVNGGAFGAPVTLTGAAFNVPGTTFTLFYPAGTYVLNTTYSISPSGAIVQVGAGPSAIQVNNGPGDVLNVNISGKMWR
jgi:hypothetical protein